MLLGKSNGFSPIQCWPYQAPAPPRLPAVEVVKNLGVKFDAALLFYPQALTVAGTYFGIIKSLKKFFDFFAYDSQEISGLCPSNI